MDVSLRKILSLLDAGNPAEVRRAVITVLGELGPRDAAAHQAVLAALADDDAEVRLRAITAAGKLRLDKALPLLAERIKTGGAEAEQAAEVAARLGVKPDVFYAWAEWGHIPARRGDTGRLWIDFTPAVEHACLERITRSYKLPADIKAQAEQRLERTAV